MNQAFTSSPCLNQRFISQQTVDYSMVKYNATTTSYYMVGPKLPCLSTLRRIVLACLMPFGSPSVHPC